VTGGLLSRPREDPAPAHLGPYISAWLVAGAVSVTVLAMWHPAFDAPVSTVLALTILTILAEWACAEVKTGSSGVTFSMLEAIAVVNLLLLPPLPAVVVTVSGVGLRHLLARRPLAKVAFNVGQHGVAASLAAGLVSLIPATPALSTPRVLMTVFAAVVYGTTNTAAMAGIFRRLDSLAITEELTERPLTTLTMTMRNASFGLAGAAMWLSHPTVTVLLVGLTLAVWTSRDPSVRFQSLYAVVSHDRDRLARVVGAVKDGIVLLDEDGAVRLWNASMERMLGIEEADALGRPAEDLLTGPDLSGVPLRPTDVETAEDDDQATVSVVTLRSTDGTDVPARLTHALLRNKHGFVTGDVLVVQDLTAEREAAAVKEDFVARVSHELRTPLTPVRGYIQTLLRRGDRIDEATRVEVLEQVVERVTHMERLIDDLLLVSRVASGKVRPTGEIDPAEVDMSRLVRRLSDWLAQGVASGHDVIVESPDVGAVAWADPVRAGQIVTNLISNACKYGSPRTPITVAVRHEGDVVEVTVTDRGPGIPADKLETVFERFQRLEDPMLMKTSGLGLGLFLSRELATAMDGTLTVTSQRGQGSSFVLQLPAAGSARSHHDPGLSRNENGRIKAHPRPHEVPESVESAV
jgi:PAS domain S-box-containing protein